MRLLTRKKVVMQIKEKPKKEIKVEGLGDKLKEAVKKFGDRRAFGY